MVVDGLPIGCSCLESCGCVGYDEKPAEFVCWATMYDCTGNFDPDFDKNCIYQYKYLNECIIHELMCGKYIFITQIPIIIFHFFLNNFNFSINSDHESIAQLKKCYVHGRIYNENDKFSIDGYECLCTDNFDNKTLISENPNCAKISVCGIVSLSQTLNGMRKGCVPVFRQSGHCPTDYRCRKFYFKIKWNSFLFSNLILKSK